ncbi:MAG: ATP-binding protein [Thiotrichaceae bacterium]|nr:ATP-binding protein [Thiotrichaceae bacterium]
MAKVSVSVKADFLKSLASAKPLPALAELIWNGFDAGSKHVDVFINKNELGGVHSITVRDDGNGIDHAKINELFGSLGESWKKEHPKLHGRALHGKKGRGRLQAFALGSYVEWKTTYEESGKSYSYRITGKAEELEDFDVTEPKEVNTSVGTTVTISNIEKNFISLKAEDRPQQKLAEMFSVYLTEYPELHLQYDGKTIDPKSVQNDRKDYILDEITLTDGKKLTPAPVVSIIEWKSRTERRIHFCDAKGISLHEIPVEHKIPAPGFNFTVYIKTDHFKELDKNNCLSELNNDVKRILDVAVSTVKTHFKERKEAAASEIVASWKKDNIYPYPDKPNIDPIELAERQFFDIFAVNVQEYLPNFEKSDFKSKKFTFSLLAQALKQNTDSVQTIISEVLGLTKDKQDDLAELLKNTKLSAIISASKVVANRLDFLKALEILVFDPESKRNCLERDQLHKILEKEAWIFHEEFSLAGSEQRLDEVLKKHLDKLGNRSDDDVHIGNAGDKRVDLMLHKTIQPRSGEFDYLIVELKRPSKKINAQVLMQIEEYAMAVAEDERFQAGKTRWTFMAISNEIDTYARNKSRQRDKPQGQIYDDGERNITVWVKTWSEIIGDARAKLQFINKQLEYQADDDSAKDYLREKHEKFIPNAPVFQTANDTNSSSAVTV